MAPNNPSAASGDLTDAIVLAACAIAASAALVQPDAALVPVKGAIGLTLLILLTTYLLRRPRTAAQNAAFGTVCGLAGLLVMETMTALIGMDVLPTLDPTTKHWAMPLVWAVLSAAFFLLAQLGAAGVRDLATSPAARADADAAEQAVRAHLP